MRFMSFVAAVSLGVVINVPYAVAENVGVAVCDNFLKVYDTCVAAKAPADQKDKMRSVMEQVKVNWTAVAKTADGKKQLETVCTQTADQLKTQLAPLGCSW